MDGKHLNGKLYKNASGRASYEIYDAESDFVARLAAMLQVHFEVWPQGQSLKVIFALPGLVLATSFVTFPFVAEPSGPITDGSMKKILSPTLNIPIRSWI